MKKLGRTACRAGAAAIMLAAAAAGTSAAAGTAAAAAASPAAKPPSAPGVPRCGAGELELPGGQAPRPGGYSCASTPYSSDVTAAAHTLMSYVDSQYPAGSARDVYYVKSAATQVVAGTNIQLVIRVCEPRREIVIGTVFRALDDAMSVTNVYVLAH